ncbi:MAG: FtsH protease activity modulator HflK [Gammaproteobacteria bacterium]|nr:FtsH protease activity modulator HflK [Gammaproteobacteria bacterium]
MAWNEPGGSKGKDPWGTQGDRQGPPDLDEIVRKLQDKFGALFGGRRGGRAGGPGSGRASSFGIGTILLVVLVLWGLSGTYTIHEGSRGVVLRFGHYHETTEAGLHWHLPYPIETIEVVNVEEIRTAEIGYRSGLGGQGSRTMAREALMLTQDENIIDIKLAIQYKVKDAKDYLFNVSNPDLTLHQSAESALRETIGKSKMDFSLTEGRSEIVARTETLTQQILDRYQTGLLVTSVNMQDAQPPEEVQDAFNDAVKAREDEDRLRNEAEAYSNDVIPKARGEAARMLEEANAYKAQVIAEAEGEASRFTQILTEYKRSPAVTRERIYLDAVKSILSNTSKVMVDVKGGNNLLYLPLDRLISADGKRDASTGSSADATRGGAAAAGNESTPERSRPGSLRGREVR